MDEENQTPEDLAIELLANNEPASATKKDLVDLYLSIEETRFHIRWSVWDDVKKKSREGKWDWVGLFHSVESADEDFIKGVDPFYRTWAWTNKDEHYFNIETDYHQLQTNLPPNMSVEARYLIWNGKKYKSIAHTGPLEEASNR